MDRMKIWGLALFLSASVVFGARAQITCVGGVLTGCTSPYYNNVTAITATLTGGVIAGWATSGRPISPAPYQSGFNSTVGAWESWNGAAWVSAAGASPVGSTGQVQTNGGGGVFAAVTNAQLTALISPFTSSTSGAVPNPGGADGTKFLSETGWAVPAGGGGGLPTTGGTMTGTLVSGGYSLYATNTASTYHGALQQIETAWNPPTGSGANNLFLDYDRTEIDAVGLSNRGASVNTDWWNTFVHVKDTYITTSTAMANSHLSADICTSYIRAASATAVMAGRRMAAAGARRPCLRARCQEQRCRFPPFPSALWRSGRPFKLAPRPGF